MPTRRERRQAEREAKKEARRQAASTESSPAVQRLASEHHGLEFLLIAVGLFIEVLAVVFGILMAALGAAFFSG